uniref:site-specific DNA-methyltransferase (adenine-specific) n=1 Tax=viral metagenome TaxID=1070528 RepID=A0A6M3ME43_9ZZZZ
MKNQLDLIQWMDKKPTLTDCKRRRMQERQIYDMALKGELDLSREDVLDIHYGSRGAAQFFTPDPAAKLLAGLAEIQPHETVLDPAAGLGNLMLPALKYTDKVKGIELVWDTRELATRYLDLDIIRADALEAEWPECDVILMNPPFGKFNGKPDWYPFKGQGKKEVAFLHLAMKRAKRRVVSIVPNSLLSNRDDIPIRKYLLEEHGVLASISLPPKTFWKSTREINKWRWPVTGTHTGILVIDVERPPGNYEIFMSTPPNVDDLPEVLCQWHKHREKQETDPLNSTHTSRMWEDSV